jgi:hypothetical protein
MQSAASTSIATQSTAAQPAQAPDGFRLSLVKAGCEAELKCIGKISEKSQEIMRQRWLRDVKVPADIVALGQAHAQTIKNIFKNTLCCKPACGASELILDYLEDDYVAYRELFYFEQDSYGMMKRFYPFVGLVFDSDGTNLHARLNVSNASSDHQMVRWHLFSTNTGSQQVKDYDLCPITCKKEHLDESVSARYMWWQAQANNFFDAQAKFQSAVPLKVVLQYSLACMIRAAMNS